MSLSWLQPPLLCLRVAALLRLFPPSKLCLTGPAAEKEVVRIASILYKILDV